MQPTVNASIRVKTQQMIIRNATAVNSLPLRKWRVEICMLDEKGDEIEADVLSDCTFHLHPTFEKPTRKVSTPPFALEEQGWGQFEIKILCNYLENAGKINIRHPLQFEDDAYAIDYSVQVPYHTAELRRRLESHFTLQETAAQIPQKSQTAASGSWINSIPLLDEDAVTEIVRMIVSHPAVRTEVLKHPRHEDFLMALHQLPTELLDEIRDYIDNSGR
ncbi:hypothetical protein HG536_0A07330 [Torulaspora globosa]|uniref:YEATS domain-containing protein n=1 Tax=Torulaspora globosa TaxID=48254 RepID=A0A7G3ZBN2_9SACH|nr:uncharacterized protein HG536_0A07330 [Torulaspora globosa]QLL30918.1 hypothetical protein HG536_0A07330 [Torulaspora globosa]